MSTRSVLRFDDWSYSPAASELLWSITHLTCERHLRATTTSAKIESTWSRSNRMGCKRVSKMWKDTSVVADVRLEFGARLDCPHHELKNSRSAEVSD